MKPRTADEKQPVLARVKRDLNRLRADAKSADCDFLAYLIATAEDEAGTQIEALEAETHPD